MCIFFLDRYEGAYAVLENLKGERVEIPASQLPAGCREGAVFRKTGGKYLFDAAYTAKRRKNIQTRFNELKDSSF